MNDEKAPLKTKHPCHGMTKAQIEAFERIAINELPFCSSKTIDILLEAGLIVPHGEIIISHDRFGTVKVPNYEVPIPIHYAWCRWYSENYSEEKEQELYS